MIKRECEKEGKNDRVSEREREGENYIEKRREGGMKERETYQHTPTAVST